MAMGIVDDNELEKEISNTSNNALVKELNRGRGINSFEVPEELRKVIIDSVIENGRAETIRDLAGPLGISPSSVSAYSNGTTSTSTYNEPVKELEDHIRSKKLNISKRAIHKISKALTLMDDSKLNESSAKELSSIAKDLAQVSKNMEPSENHGPINGGPTFVVFQPRMREEKSYETIVVQE